MKLPPLLFALALTACATTSATPAAPTTAVEEALADLKARRLVIVTDDDSRENEGDPIGLAQPRGEGKVDSASESEAGVVAK